MHALSRPTLVAAGLGGLLWTVKALVITANDGSFDPLESVFFIGGLLSLVAAAVLAGLDLARRFRGIGRVAATVGAAVGLVIATLVVEQAGKGLVSALATGDNVGLEQEGGILCCGLAWLAIAITGLAARRTVQSRPAPAKA